MISYGVTSWVNVTPTFSHAGRPAMKLSSITHCIKSSQHTSVTLPGFVTGVILSTIEFGNVTFFFAHAATSGYFASKYDINAHLAALPFICMLSARKNRNRQIFLHPAFESFGYIPEHTARLVKIDLISPFGNGERDDFYLLRCKFSDDRLTIYFPPCQFYKRTNQHTILFAGRAACRQLIYAVVFLEGVEQDPVRRHNHGSEYPPSIFVTDLQVIDLCKLRDVHDGSFQRRNVLFRPLFQHDYN